MSLQARRPSSRRGVPIPRRLDFSKGPPTRFIQQKVADKTLFTNTVGMTGRFGFDPRSSWDTLNTGYSPNDQGEEVDSYPATELLAAIGLQTFPPLAGQ